MKSEVSSATGKVIELEVAETDTVEEVKSRIAESDDIPVEQQRLLLGDVQLEDGKTLADYNLQSGAVLNLALRWAH